MIGALPHPGRAVRSALRKRIEQAIEASLDAARELIALLDEVDGDPCQEPEDPDATAAEWSGRGAHRFNVAEAA